MSAIQHTPAWRPQLNRVLWDLAVAVFIIALIVFALAVYAVAYQVGAHSVSSAAVPQEPMLPAPVVVVAELPTETPVPTVTLTREPTATDTPAATPTRTSTPKPTRTNTPRPTKTATVQPVLLPAKVNTCDDDAIHRMYLDQIPTGLDWQPLDALPGLGVFIVTKGDAPKPGVHEWVIPVSGGQEFDIVWPVPARGPMVAHYGIKADSPVLMMACGTRLERELLFEVFGPDKRSSFAPLPPAITVGDYVVQMGTPLFARRP